MGVLGGVPFALLTLVWCQGVVTAGPLTELTEPLVSVVDNFLALLIANATNICSNQVKAIVDEANEGRPWALSVLDASGRPDSGLLTGGLTFPGSYSQCLSSSSSSNSSDEVSQKHQHCLANLQFGDINQTQLVLPRGLLKALNGSLVRLGICFPTTCHFTQSTDALNTALSLSFPGTNVVADLGECSSHIDRPSTLPLAIIICIFSILLFLTLVGTVLDAVGSCHTSIQDEKVTSPSAETPEQQTCSASSEQLCTAEKERKKGYCLVRGETVKRILLSFSFLNNGSKILHVGGEHNAGSVDCFHGIRFLSMTWIITGHTFSFALLWMSFRNQSAMSQSPSYLLSQTIANGTLSVDSFFYLSGFLLIYVAMKHLKKSPEKFSVPALLLHRYIRLTPLMMLIIAFCVALLPWTGQGPFWNPAVQMYGPWCRKNWWINALYLQNFVDTENMCLSHSWYSAVDMQFFVVAVFVVAVLRKKTVLGLGLILLLFLATAIVTITLTVVHHLPGTSYIGLLPLADMTAYQVEVYIKPYGRMGPYLVGMLAGYWMHSPQDLVQLRRRYVVTGWILATILNLVVLYSTWPAYEGYLPTTAGAAAYSALARTSWAVGLAWMTYACMTGNGGVVNKILSWKALVPLSRLTYCAYLIHPVVMAAFYGSRETTFDFTIYFMIYLILGNFTITYVAAFVLSTLLESPFIALEKIIFGS